MWIHHEILHRRCSSPWRYYRNYHTDLFVGSFNVMLIKEVRTGAANRIKPVPFCETRCGGYRHKLFVYHDRWLVDIIGGRNPFLGSICIRSQEFNTISIKSPTPWQAQGDHRCMSSRRCILWNSDTTFDKKYVLHALRVESNVFPPLR